MFTVICISIQLGAGQNCPLYQDFGNLNHIRVTLHGFRICHGGAARSFSETLINSLLLIWSFPPLWPDRVLPRSHSDKCEPLIQSLLACNHCRAIHDWKIDGFSDSEFYESAFRVCPWLRHLNFRNNLIEIQDSCSSPTLHLE